MSRLNRWSWLVPRPRRQHSPRRKQRAWIGSSYARRLRVEALEDRRLLAVTGFEGPYDLEGWIISGIAGGTTSITTVSSATDDASFGYNVNLGSGGVSQRTADFTVAGSPVTGSVRFDYQFTGNHAFFQANADFALLVDGNATPIVAAAPTSGAFTFSGSATLVARQGESFGFRIGGKNFDSFSQIVGTLTITNFQVFDSIVVDSAADTVDGDFSPGNMTLREAIGLANTIPGADTITFADGMSGQTILLGGTDLAITQSLTIDATALAENVTIDAQQQSRVINFSGSLNNLTLGGLTMRNGRNASGGGGIRFDSGGTLTLNQSTLTGCSTTGAGASGGGIYTLGGHVALNQSTLSANTTAGSGAKGGGIFDLLGNVGLFQSTLTGNTTVGPSANGGAVYARSGHVVLNQSTLSGNSTAGAGADGGGVFVGDSLANVSVLITNSILAGNNVGAGSTGPDVVPDPQGALAVNFSLIGTAVTPTSGGNNVSTDAPLLGPLANNGGPTQTRALLPGSPALDAGNPSIIFNPAEFDQRGAPFVRVFGGRLDVGAFERSTLVVDSAGDTVDGNFGPGQFTLREAIGVANVIPGANTITFADGMSGQTILLTGAELEIMDSLSIDATALAENVTIDAQQLSRVIYIGSASFDPVDVTLGGLTIQNGKTTGVNFTSGGGILFGFTGTLELNRSKVTGNSTEGLEASGGGISAYEVAVTLINSEVSNNSTLGDRAYGGGVRSRNGAVTLVGSTVSGNRTTGMDAKGGGIFSPNGDVTLNDSTLSGNSTMGASAHGGGIYAPSNVTLNQSTLSGNSTAGESASGGGIFTSFGAVTLNQSTLSGNSTAGDNAKGGGILTNSGAVTLASSTLSGNSTAGDFAHGGGIFTRYGVVTLNQSTLTGNSTTGAGASGGGIIVTNGAVVAPVTIRNSIVAGNTVAAGSTGPDLVAGSGSPTTVNFSLIGTGITPAAGGNNFSTNAPVLGPLTFNGGPTQTHALLPGSPALDAGDPNGGAAHNYELNGSQTDELGGSVLIAAGGVLTATGYDFGPNQGLNLSGAVAADEYSIELVFSFDALGGYQKIIDFKNLTNDNGIYSTGTNLDFFGGGAFANNVFTAAVPAHLVVTRDADTERVAVYIDAVEVLNFVDAGDVAVFSGPSQIIRFFQDDAATGGSEAAAGFVDRIRIYDRALSTGEVAGLMFDQRGEPSIRVYDGNGMGGARIDIGAFESQPNPLPGDYNFNGIVDAADYSVWRDTLGSTTDLRADGDGNGTVQPADYNFWKSHFGQTLPPGAGGGAGALALTEPALKSDKAIVPVPAESIAAPVEAKVDAVRASGGAMLAAHPARHDWAALWGAAPPRERTNSFRVAESARDHLLLLLASDRLGHSSQQDFSVIHDGANDDHRADDLDKQDLVDDPLALALAEWQ